jgi:anaerobic magnesium-protoporphyrin IX monomethyl ester cyclase
MLLNPPYQTLTSNQGVGHQVPLGLLMVGGPLLDAGHDVRLLDAECHRLSTESIVRAVGDFRPHTVLTGHAGSTPAHPICMEVLRAIKAAMPDVVTIYGGVYPTYHAQHILESEPCVDVIVRGEGEATAVELIDQLERRGPLSRVESLVYRDGDTIVLTAERQPIRCLDFYRAGWELIENWSNYQCFGLGRAAIVQFSRGCPHRCTYCGQHGFWVQWRHRDPVKLADEIEWLHHTHDVRFITLADENPTTLQHEWKRFLEELARRRLPVHFFATIRATDIVRDADLLPLYRQAGILYVLMGIESTDDEVLQKIHKSSTVRHDLLACRLLKEQGIFSILGHIVGFGDETWATFRRALQCLKRYDGDWLNAMYVTPHSWTPFGREVAERPLVETDQGKWDYRHQVLAQKYLAPWQLFVAVKWLEFRFHVRPTRLWDLIRCQERSQRYQLLWTYLHIGSVWLSEIGEFVASILFRSCLSRRSAAPVRSRAPSVPIHAAPDSNRTRIVQTLR